MQIVRVKNNVKSAPGVEYTGQIPLFYLERKKSSESLNDKPKVTKQAEKGLKLLFKFLNVVYIYRVLSYIEDPTDLHYKIVNWTVEKAQGTKDRQLVSDGTTS